MLIVVTELEFYGRSTIFKVVSIVDSLPIHAIPWLAS